MHGCLLYSKLGLNWERIYVTFVDCLESERNILDTSRKKVWLFLINVINLKIFFNRKIKSQAYYNVGVLSLVLRHKD